MGVGVNKHLLLLVERVELGEAKSSPRARAPSLTFRPPSKIQTLGANVVLGGRSAQPLTGSTGWLSHFGKSSIDATTRKRTEHDGRTRSARKVTEKETGKVRQGSKVTKRLHIWAAKLHSKGLRSKTKPGSKGASLRIHIGCIPKEAKLNGELAVPQSHYYVQSVPLSMGMGQRKSIS
uniref:Uncharacterized protein n=1 Tax=Globodera rostochiensis TaxID=31243 RepID=A0A914I8L2_GLORO